MQCEVVIRGLFPGWIAFKMEASGKITPIGTALCMVHAIWDSVEEPDFVMSLGTGFQRQ